MRKIEQAFGFHPETLRADTATVRIRTLPELGKTVEDVLTSAQVDDGWFYAPQQRTHNFMSGKIRERPFNACVFGLPRTHTLELAKATGEDHAAFHLWSLSFFLGMRQTATEAGFLAATPVKRGKLVDFLLPGRG